MRRFILVLAVGALSTLAPVSASAAPLLLWTLVVSPLTAVANQSTTFTFNATNVDAMQDLGCLEVDLPSSFVIEGTGTPTASNGRAWEASVSVGNVVMVYSLSGGGRLNPGEVVTFTIRARPTVAGPFSLPNHSHVSQNCNGTDQPGLAVPITVLPGATPTPIPTPTPRPTPRPTATPTPLPPPTLPLPTLPLPSRLPTASPPGASPSASASPGSVFASSSPRASGSPAASGSAEPSAPGPGTAGGPSAGGTGGSAPQVRLEPADLTLNMQLSDLLGSAQVWFVPAAAIGAPGLLVLLWVLLQTAGTLVWFPFIRRMRGEKPVRSGRSRRVPVR